MKRNADLNKMQSAAGRASAVMKTLGHPGRLMILCNLAEDLDMSQSALSQHLARMRSEGLVETRRESQTVYYRLGDGEARSVIESLYRIFCPT